MRKSLYPKAARAVPGLAGDRFRLLWLEVSVIGRFDATSHPGRLGDWSTHNGLIVTILTV